MATRSLISLVDTSLLVVVFLVFGHVASANQNVVHQNSSEFGSTNSTAGVLSPRGDDWCPAVCPGCPACPPSPRQIPPGYKYYEGLGYYKMHYEYVKWLEGKFACEREGGYLVVLNSQKEANLASNFLTKYNLPQMLVGFHDVTNKGKYITTLGDPLTSTGYVSWRPGEPNHVGKENCGSFYPNQGINDVDCNEPWPFLCELFV